MKIFQNFKGWLCSVFKEAMGSGIPAYVGLIGMFSSIVVTQAAVFAISVVKAFTGSWLMSMQIYVIGSMLSIITGIVVGCLIGWATSCIVRLVNKIKQS